MSIRSRLVLILLLCMLPILALSVYSARQAYLIREERVYVSHLATAESMAGAVSEFIGGVVNAQKMLSISIAQSGLTPLQMTHYFAEAHKEISILDTIGFAGPDGRIIAGNPATLTGIDISRRAYFREIINGKEWAVSHLLTSRLTGKISFVVAHRVEKNGRLIGVLFSAISPSTLQSFVSYRSVPDLGYSILDSRGQIVATTVIPQALIPRNMDRSWEPGIREALSGRPSFIPPFLDKVDGIRKIGAAAPVPRIGWAVDAIEPISTALAPARQRATLDTATYAIIIAILLILTWLLANRIAEPVKELACRADAVANGDFSQRMVPPDEAEIGRLSDAFNNMTTQLDRFRQEERAAAEQASFFADIGMLLSSTMDNEAIFQSASERTGRFMGDMTAMLCIDPNGELLPVASYAKSPSLLDSVNEFLSTGVLRTGTGITGKAVKENRTHLIPSPDLPLDPEDQNWLDKLSIRTAVLGPIQIRNTVIGILLVLSTESPLPSNAKQIMVELTRRVEMRLENIRLFEETAEREELQESLARLAAYVSQTLDPRVVLESVCTQTKELLKADAVHVWVLQEDEGRLEGVAASGYGAQEFIGSTVSLDEDAAVTSAIRSKRAYCTNRLQQEGGLNPALAERFGVQSAMLLPLVSGGEALGVMVVTDIHDPEHFTEDMLNTAGLIVPYAAAALGNARAYQHQLRIAETLQRSLLSEIPQSADGFELAHFYTSARREAAIGGDFYDFIEISEDLFEVIVGDVSGKGLQAAVITALARYVTRAYALEDSTPEAVSSRANDAIVKYTEPDIFITFVCCLLDAKTGVITYTSAGHEPVLIYRASTHTVEYGTAHGMAAGICSGSQYYAQKLSLGAGDMLVIYTDGLTDARTPNGEFLRQEGLARLVLEAAGPHAQQFLCDLMDKVRDYSGGQFSDDIAVLIVRPKSPPDTI